MFSNFYEVTPNVMAYRRKIIGPIDTADEPEFFNRITVGSVEFLERPFFHQDAPGTNTRIAFRDREFLCRFEPKGYTDIRAWGDIVSGRAAQFFCFDTRVYDVCEAWMRGLVGDEHHISRGSRSGAMFWGTGNSELLYTPQDGCLTYIRRRHNGHVPVVSIEIYGPLSHCEVSGKPTPGEVAAMGKAMGKLFGWLPADRGLQ
jgi:hypothetical protein